MNFALALLPIPRHVTPHPRPHQRALGLDIAIGRNIALPRLAAKRPVQQRLKQVLGLTQCLALLAAQPLVARGNGGKALLERHFAVSSRPVPHSNQANPRA